MASPLRRSPAEIRRIDTEWKESVDPDFERDAVRLDALFESRARSTVRAHLRALGMGDKQNLDPIQVGTVLRLIEMLSVLYQQPAVRTLVVDDKPMSPGRREAMAFRHLARSMQLDQVWAHVDRKRNLLRQCVLLFAESLAHRTIVSRVYEPYNVMRVPSAGAADVLDEDEAVAFCIRWHEEPAKRLYQVWQHEDDDTWRCWNVQDDGALLPKQPYGEEGVAGFDGLPAVLVTDELLLGRAWLPVPQSRLSLALNIDAVANDVQLLVKHEGHTQTVVASSDPAGVPDEVGADKVWKVPDGTTVEKLASSPKIEEAGQTTERWLAMLALSESLPVDAFARNRQMLTGASLMVAERDLERRRTRQTGLTAQQEQMAYRKYAAIANEYGKELGLEPLDVEMELNVSFATPTAYQDVPTLQNSMMKDLSIGAASLPRYVAAMQRCSLDEAKLLLRIIEEERREFPLPTNASELIAERVETSSASTTTSASTTLQNPGALIEGPRPAGVDATPREGAMNPDRASSVEGASVTAAAMRAV